ncbi:hypothetical protein COT97_04145 [Candidatus Falkowbacteria bacterium CG10_big_fil_rev_8_21_14_0_10_39_11]|uniref:Uncharacterized protein n=1 Tax=Candidatus Falkowbacteria bacterium CG10_big_fil_rev_8_21_14_0_10_39_11 TaxID=1974565 RepID=A0A2H0V4B4_9BACT|nr:MAG: hypothetical protein COT97_04145 [Candidatus Falkowbacteria bacterium CG10_big_fil_rev_8_21_14_0_10_39_11]
MLESGDVLNYVIAGSVVLFTIFLCILLFNIIKLLRQANRAVDEVRRKIEAVHELISGGFSKFGMMSEVAKYALGHFMGEKKKTQTTKARKTTKNKK